MLKVMEFSISYSEYFSLNFLLISSRKMKAVLTLTLLSAKQTKRRFLSLLMW